MRIRCGDFSYNQEDLESEFGSLVRAAYSPAYAGWYLLLKVPLDFEDLTGFEVLGGANSLPGAVEVARRGRTEPLHYGWAGM